MYTNAVFPEKGRCTASAPTPDFMIWGNSQVRLQATTSSAAGLLTAQPQLTVASIRSKQVTTICHGRSAFIIGEPGWAYFSHRRHLPRGIQVRKVGHLRARLIWSRDCGLSKSLVDLARAFSTRRRSLRQELTWCRRRDGCGWPVVESSSRAEARRDRR